jgi:hypothetical protein
MMDNCPIATKFNEMEKEIESLTIARDSFRKEANEIMRLHLDWCHDHQDLVEMLIDKECENLEMALHCLYEKFIQYENTIIRSY